jgi:hypothetical protein
MQWTVERWTAAIITPSFKFAGDEARRLLKLSPEEFKTYCYSLSFIPDLSDREEFRAPWVIREFRGGDCDDGALLCAIYARIHSLKYRWSFYGAPTGRSITHVATELSPPANLNIDPFGDDAYIVLYTDNWRK